MEKPINSSMYLKAKVGYINNYDSTNVINIDFPFDRYYMEESKAYAAEKSYRSSLSDSTWL